MLFFSSIAGCESFQLWKNAKNVWHVVCFFCRHFLCQSTSNLPWMVSIIYSHVVNYVYLHTIMLHDGCHLDVQYTVYDSLTGVQRALCNIHTYCTSEKNKSIHSLRFNEIQDKSHWLQILKYLTLGSWTYIIKQNMPKINNQLHFIDFKD